ncbi:MAG: response regulator, partial [Fibrobacter sp.]|nr:response regulator [Fibrobacter sp.]
MSNERAKILIVDDDAMNRVVLSDLLSDEYDIIEAKDGDEALEILEKQAKEITLVLLDMVMPGRDGLEVLKIMNEKDWIKGTPVVMISAETSTPQVEKAFSLGVTDFIYRPFDQMVVQTRVRNTINLYVKQMQLSELVADKIYERTRNSDMLISILSHIVEFRNGESGQHVLHIKKITDILLRALLKRTQDYKITEEEIGTIATASSMHDIGK